MLDHEKWLVVAEDDLKGARGFLSLQLYRKVGYECQQAAEKALKGYLSLKRKPIIKVHDLVKLLELCMLFDTSFGKLIHEAESLNPFSTKFRYPCEYDLPDNAEAEELVKYAEKIVRFVSKKITESDSGQKSLLSE